MKNSILYLLLFIVVWGYSSCTESEVFLSGFPIVNVSQSRSIPKSSEYYYYYKGEKIPLNVHPTKLYVVVEQDNSDIMEAYEVREGQESYYVNETQRGYIVDIDTAQTSKIFIDMNTSISLAKDDNIVAVEYVIGDSILIPVSNKFYVKLKKLVDISLLEKYARIIGCKVEDAIASDDYWIRLSSNKNSMLNSLEASNFMYETGDFEDVDPGFIFNFQSCSTPIDELYSSQWNLHSMYGIRADSAWGITKGNSNIIVAIVDGGINEEHPDLTGRIYPNAYNCNTDNNNSTYFRNHGTQVAGIIAANHNYINLAGIAPNVSLMNISSSLDNSRDNLSEELANGITYAWKNGADIINNSWGDWGGSFYNKLHSSILENAITTALIQGRDGKGCVVIFASGNTGTIDYPAYFTTDIMVVGATNSNGNVTSFSGKGTSLDVVAPGDNIPLLDLSGTTIGSGTSFAAPHVSGLAALILSLNPNLTQSQVNTIIKETASGMIWNSTQGYGCINALNALKTVQGDYSIVNTNYGNVAYAEAKFFIPNLPQSASVQWSTLSGKATIINTIARDTVVFKYDFTGQTLTDEIQATVTYCGMVSNHILPITITNAPKIFGVEQFELMSSDDKKNFKILCSDPNATFVWECDNYFMTWIDFPFASDAGFSDTPQLYKTLSIDGYISSGSYPLSVTASNQYGWETYNFEYIHP